MGGAGWGREKGREEMYVEMVRAGKYKNKITTEKGMGASSKDWAGE